MPPNTGTSMTLAIKLAAAQQLADPAQAIVDAKSWARYVGLVSDEPTYKITNFARTNSLDLDFFSGPGALQESLNRIASEFSADRYVIVCDSAVTEPPTSSGDWEHLEIETAAEAAGWELASNDTPSTGNRADSTHDDWP